MEQFTSYLVGGAVRDTLMGFDPKDRDYVVVGASPARMLELGFEEVGQGFPVFLHPETREEYALARRERKTGPGYGGFEFDVDTSVSLEDDLSRRDLTINSMAMRDGVVVDPFGGQEDLKNRILRHTSDAFGEDPLRVIRLARFFARYRPKGFSVAPETMELAAEMVRRGDLNELPTERFWLEIEKAFSDAHPEMFFDFLTTLKVYDYVKFFKETFARGSSIAMAKSVKLMFPQRPDMAVTVFSAWRSFSDTKNFYSSRAKELFDTVNAYADLGGPPTAEELVRFFQKNRFFSEGTRFDDFLMALGAYEGCTPEPVVYLTWQNVLMFVNAARTVTAEPFQHLKGREIGDAMFRARVAAVEAVLPWKRT